MTKESQMVESHKAGIAAFHDGNASVSMANILARKHSTGANTSAKHSLPGMLAQ